MHGVSLENRYVQFIFYIYFYQLNIIHKRLFCRNKNIKHLKKKEMVIFGPSFLIAYCGVFGGREIVDFLKILRDLFRISSFSFLEL